MSRRAPQTQLQSEQHLNRSFPAARDTPQSVQPTQVLHSPAQQSQLRHGHAAAICRSGSELQKTYSSGSVEALQRQDADLLLVGAHIFRLHYACCVCFTCARATNADKLMLFAP